VLGLNPSPAQLQALADYLGLLQRWNATYNLTAVRDPGAMLTQHLADCLAVLGPLDGIPVSVKVRVPPWRARDAPVSPRRATGQHLHAQCHHQRRQPHPGGLCASLRRHFVRAAGGTGVRAAWQDEHGRVWHGIKHRAKRLRSNR
jgi:hypothetical protein